MRFLTLPTRHAKLVLLAAGVLLGFALTLLPQLTFQSTPDELLSAQTASENGGSSLISTVEIQLWPTDPDTIPVEAARSVHRVLLRTPGVVNVLSTFQLFLPTDGGNWQPAFPLDQDPSVSLPTVAAAIPRSLSAYFEDESRTFRLIAVVDESAGLDLDQLGQAVAESLGDASDVNHSVGGVAPTFRDLANRVNEDQRRLFLLSLLFGFLAGAVLFRDLRLPLLMVLPPVLTLVVLLSGLALLNIPVTILTISVTTLLLIVGVADAIHIYVQWVRESPDHHGPEPAMRRALAKMVPVVAMTTGTTGFCFLAVAFVGSESLSRLGLIGTAGCAIQFISLTLVWPSILLSLRSTVWQIWPNEARLVPAIQLSSYRPRSGFWVAGIIVLVAALLALQVTSTSHLAVADASPQEGSEAPTAQAMADPEDVRLPIRITTQLADSLSLLDDDGWSAFAAMASELRNSGIGTLVSVDEGLLTMAMGERNLALETLLQPSPFGARTTPSIDLEAPAMLLLVPWDKNLVVLRDQLSEIEATLQVALPIDRLRLSPVIAGLIDQTDRTVIELRSNALIAMVLAVLVLTFVFRSVRVGFALLVCNALPVLAVLSFVQLIWGGIGIEVAMAATIAFGIALDDSIHTVSCLRRHGALDDASEENVARAMRSIGPILMTTSVILITGMAAMLFSSFAPVERYGIAIMLALALALFSDLVVLPSFLRTFAMQKPRANKR